MKNIKYIAMALLVLANFSVGGTYIGLSTLAFFLMCLGLYFRKNLLYHQRLMLSAILLDLSIVFSLEVSREAIETTMSKPLAWTQYVHIAASLLAVLLYVAQVVLGVRLKQNLEHSNLRNLHRKIGYACFSFRAISFAFMYSMASQ